MEDHIVLYQHHTQDGKSRVWEGWLESTEVFTRHGVLGGALQEVIDTPGPKGVAGTKTFVSAERQARRVLERRAKKKREEGYVEQDTPQTTTLDLSRGPLPKNLCFPKPLQQLSEGLPERYGAISDMDFCFTRKRDGEMAPVVKTGDGTIRIYSRRMDEIQDKFPHLLLELDEWLPGETILLGELVAPGPVDDRAYVASVLRSNTERALQIQRDKGPLWLYVFSVFVFGGKPLWHTETLEQILHRVGLIPESQHVKQVELLGVEDLPSLSEVIHAEHWEGAVVYLRDGRMDEQDLRFSGKSSRPKVSWKVKPVREMDLVVTDWDTGSGKNRYRLGSVRLGAYRAGSLVDMGWCGAGFNDEQRDEWGDSVVGQVVEVQYDSITPDNKLLVPRFIRLRPDKPASECILEE